MDESHTGGDSEVRKKEKGLQSKYVPRSNSNALLETIASEAAALQKRRAYNKKVQNRDKKRVGGGITKTRWFSSKTAGE